MREVFPTWEAVLAAPRSRIAATIRPGGLANIKTRRIKAALRWVRAQRGRLDLRFLRRLPLDEGRRVLEGLRGAGIGPKTAACVLLFACGKEAFPVDTHIHRVGKRLGLLGPCVTREQAHAVFETLISPGEAYPLHLNLIRHGRQVCHARRPHCERCVLLRHCPYGQRYGDR
ncbi:MAG: endonuclease III [Deltaproteobacteria bacterium]|nr:endonuclease III [Deltaproteobacteria bacterium]